MNNKISDYLLINISIYIFDIEKNIYFLLSNNIMNIKKGRFFKMKSVKNF